MTRRARRGIRYVVVIALVAGACGGGSDAGDQLSDQTSSTTQASSQVTTAPTGVLPTALPDVPGLSSECQGLANLVLGMTQVFAGDTSAVDGLFATASENLPRELSGEVELIKGAVLQYQAALEETGIDLSDPTSFATLTPEQVEALDAAYAPLQSTAVSDAFDAVGAYGEVECAEFAPGG